MAFKGPALMNVLRKRAAPLQVFSCPALMIQMVRLVYHAGMNQNRLNAGNRYQQPA